MTRTDNRYSVHLIERIESYSEVGGKFGMIVQGEPCFRLLRLKDFHAAESLIDSSIPAPLRGLDVTILREAIMNHGLGMDGENAEGKIEYTPSNRGSPQKSYNRRNPDKFCPKPYTSRPSAVGCRIGP